ALVAAGLVKSGVHKRVLTVAFEKQSESDAMWALSMRIPFQPALVAGAGGYFAPHIRSYIRRSNAPDHIGILVAVKDRQNALKNPYAHLHLEDISYEKVAESMMIWDPLRYLESCPSSDGACAMVLSAEDTLTGERPSTPPVACSAPSPLGPRACSATPRPPCRSGSRRASTRSTASAPQWATPTAAAPSSIPCASSPGRSRSSWNLPSPQSRKRSNGS